MIKFSSKRTQQHLTRVYATLAGGILTSISFFILNQFIQIPVAIYVILMFASLVFDLYNCCCSRNKNEKLRYVSYVFYAIGLGGGFGAATYSMTLAQRESYYQMCLSALLMTGLTFFSFSIFAILTQKRLAIYIGSMVLSLILAIISLFVFNVMAEIVIGIMIAVSYVIFDTQTMIHRAENGVYDTLYDAYMLFVDFAKLFIKFLELMQKKEKEKEKEKEKKKEKN